MLTLRDYFARNEAFAQRMSRVQKRNLAWCAKAIYTAPLSVQRNVPLPVCQLVAEFTAPVCTNARPFDGRPHALGSVSRSCDGCTGTLCDDCLLNVNRGFICNHLMCRRCVTKTIFQCDSCGRRLTGCKSCRTEVRCAAGKHTLQYCSMCSPRHNRHKCRGCAEHFPEEADYRKWKRVCRK